jgi:putative ABC transport system substrate-binding protein
LPAIIAAAHAAEDKEALPFVAVTAIIRNASIDALYTGMTDALRDAGYRDGDSVRLRFESAESDAVKAAELVRLFGRGNADVIVAFTEPSARIAATERLRAPLVIAGIDPETAEDIRRNRKARHVTGIVNAERYDTQLTLIREVAPQARTVAVPVDADNPSGKEAMKEMTAFARSIDLAVERLPVSVENEVIAATIEEYSPDDTVILLDTRIFPGAPVARIIAAAEAANLLVFASDEDTVVRGALAAIVPDPYGTGRQVGRLVASILRQASSARASLQTAEPSYIVINQDTAARAGIDIPDAVLARRGRIIGWADTDGPRPRGKPVAPEPPPTSPPSSEDSKEP